MTVVDKRYPLYEDTRTKPISVVERCGCQIGWAV